MDRRQYLFLGAGILLACLMFGSIAARRALDQPAAPASADFAPPRDDGAAAPGQPEAPGEASAAARSDFASPPDEPAPPAQPAPRPPPGLPQALVEMLDRLDPSKPQGGEEPGDDPTSSEPLPADLDLAPPADATGEGEETDGEADATPSLPADLDLSPPGSAPPPPPPAPASTTNEGTSPVRQLGPFRVVEEDDEVVSVYGPDGEAVVSTLRGAHLGLAGKVGRHPALLLVEKTCPDPCNPRSQLFVARGRSVEPLLDVQGMIELVDLDGKPPAELRLSHLMETTSELVSLPFRFERGRFVNGSALFSQELDRQLEWFGAAVEERCPDLVNSTCAGAIRAYLGLAVFRSGPRADRLIALLPLSPFAREYLETSREEVEAEIESLAE